jgi:hypothetical protein
MSPTPAERPFKPIPPLLYHGLEAIRTGRSAGVGTPVGGTPADHAASKLALPTWAHELCALAEQADVAAFQALERAVDVRGAARVGAAARRRIAGSKPQLHTASAPDPIEDNAKQLMRIALYNRGRADALAWWVRHVQVLVHAHRRERDEVWLVTAVRHFHWFESLAQLEHRAGQGSRASGWWKARSDVQQVLATVPLPSGRSAPRWFAASVAR